MTIGVGDYVRVTRHTLVAAKGTVGEVVSIGHYCYVVEVGVECDVDGTYPPRRWIDKEHLEGITLFEFALHKRLRESEQ